MPLVVAACKRAAIFADCQGSTRGSLMPVVSITAGYFVPSLDVSVGTHFIQFLEAVLGLDAAEFGNVRHAVRRRLDAQHVQAADLNDGRAEKIGPFGDGPANQDAAGAAAFTGQLVRRRVFVLEPDIRRRR